jgi:hypothetical protein
MDSYPDGLRMDIFVIYGGVQAELGGAMAFRRELGDEFEKSRYGVGGEGGAVH